MEYKVSKENTCCFFGHRKILNNKYLGNKVKDIAESLITRHNIFIFLFGSKSEFDDTCYNVITQLKLKYPHIKRIYVRGEHQHISDQYEKYILKSYEYTYYPKKIIGAGKAVYIKRNYEMIDKSKYCIAYYNKDYLPPVRKSSLNIYQPKSGTMLAYNYAKSKKKIIINLFE